MALPNTDLCLRIDLDLSSLINQIDLPGGLVIALQTLAGDIPDVGAEYMKLLGQASSALAPLSPFFTALGAVLAIFDCIKAIPESLVPPNPGKLAAAIAAAVEKVEALLQLIPQLSIPFLIKSLLGAIINALKGIENRIRAMINALNKILSAFAINIPGVNLSTLQSNLACAQANLQLQADALNAGFGPLAKLLCVINLFLDLLGQAPIAPFSFSLQLQPIPADQILAPMDDIIQLLQTIYDAIPLPGGGAAC